MTSAPAIVEPRRIGSKVGPARLGLNVLTVVNITLLLLMGLGLASKWQAGPPKGDSVIDFTTYYSGGRMTRVDRGAHLYDLVAQAKDQTDLAGIAFDPAAKKLQVVGFVNPPTSTLLLRPLSLLPLASAYRVWMLVDLILLVFAGWFVLQSSGGNRRPLRRKAPLEFVFPALAMAAAFPVGAALLQGALTPVVVLGFALFAKGVIGAVQPVGNSSPGIGIAAPGQVLAVAERSTNVKTLFSTPEVENAAERGNVFDLFTSVGLLLIGIKPQYVLLPLAVLVGLRRFRAIVFTALFQTVLMALSALIVRPSAWIDYLKLLGTYNREIDTYGSSTSSMINVRGILASWLGASNPSIINSISSAVLVAAVIGIGYLAHRSHRANTSEQRTVLVIATLLAGLIASPHAHSHDWTLALVALALAWFLPSMTTAKRCVLTLVPLVSFVTMSGVGSALGKTPVVIALACLATLLVKQMHQTEVSETVHGKQTA